MDFQLLLNDLTGKTVRTENYTFPAGEQALSLDLGTLPAGLYVAQIRSVQHGTVVAFKVVRE